MHDRSPCTSAGLRRAGQIRYRVRITAHFVLIASGIITVGTACAQGPPEPAVAEDPRSATPHTGPRSDAAPLVQPAFDVVSIHPNNYDHRNHSHIYYSLGDSHFRSINATVMQIIQWAYELPDSRILNAAAWTTSAKYDVEAKSDAAADKMVQALLADRFHLRVHIESRELPVYYLVVDKGGPKFSSVPDAPQHVDSSSRGGSATLTITSSTHALSDLAEMLYRYTGRVVIDKTGPDRELHLCASLRIGRFPCF
jgi:hypothetical protein